MLNEISLPKHGDKLDDELLELSRQTAGVLAEATIHFPHAADAFKNYIREGLLLNEYQIGAATVFAKTVASLVDSSPTLARAFQDKFQGDLKEALLEELRAEEASRASCVRIFEPVQAELNLKLDKLPKPETDTSPPDGGDDVPF